eukprot:78582-Lingulodinium_polyedra.AAC.1
MERVSRSLLSQVSGFWGISQAKRPFLRPGDCAYVQPASAPPSASASISVWYGHGRSPGVDT